MRGAILAMALLACGDASAAAPREPACAVEAYFAPDDPDRERPLTAPHAELRAMIRQAASGNAAEQRSLAISYDTGFMVEPCPARAQYWYGRAAEAGDTIARQWVARQQAIERLRAGPQCGGAGCTARTDAGSGMELHAQSNGHFIVPVTISDVTVQGVVDTGATHLAIPSKVADRMKIAWRSGVRGLAMTANGPKVFYAVPVATVRVGNLTLNNVEASVSEGDFPVLVGMSFLRKFNVQMVGNRMMLGGPGATRTADTP